VEGVVRHRAHVNAGDEKAIRVFFESFMEPQQVIAPDGATDGLVTGYYEPLLRGARKKGGPYQTPLYKVPDDMLTIDLASVYPELKGMRLRGKLVGKKVVPYATRADIEKADFTGKELLWVDDPVESFFLQVQGSGPGATDRYAGNRACGIRGPERPSLQVDRQISGGERVN
jgi:membrane-bound lytic murein transglycosylase A